MKTRVVYTKIWEDSWFKQLSNDAKLLWLYLITNSRIELTGIYEITDIQIEFDTGIKKIKDVKEELYPKAIFKSNWVCLPKAHILNQFKGPQNDTAKNKWINSIPKEIIQYFIGILDTLSIPYVYPIDTTSNKKLVISNKKPVISNKNYTTTDSSKLVHDLENWERERKKIKEVKKNLIKEGVLRKS